MPPRGPPAARTCGLEPDRASGILGGRARPQRVEKVRSPVRGRRTQKFLAILKWLW